MGKKSEVARHYSGALSQLQGVQVPQALAALLPGLRWVYVLGPDCPPPRPDPGCPVSGPGWAHVLLWPGLCINHIVAPALSTWNVKIDNLKTVDFELGGFLKYFIKWFEGKLDE